MDITALIQWLQGHDTAGLQALATESGIPFHTLRKIASGETRNPGVYTLLPVMSIWQQRETQA